MITSYRAIGTPEFEYVIASILGKRSNGGPLYNLIITQLIKPTGVDKIMAYPSIFLAIPTDSLDIDQMYYNLVSGIPQDCTYAMLSDMVLEAVKFVDIAVNLVVDGYYGPHSIVQLNTLLNRCPISHKNMYMKLLSQFEDKYQESLDGQPIEDVIDGYEHYLPHRLPTLFDEIAESYVFSKIYHLVEDHHKLQLVKAFIRNVSGYGEFKHICEYLRNRNKYLYEYSAVALSRYVIEHNDEILEDLEDDY